MLFEGIPSPFEATRYHSLIVDRTTLPSGLQATAWTPDGEIMALSDLERPHYGVQFHPESYLCHHGKRLLANFLRGAGLPLKADWREVADAAAGSG